MKTDHVIVALMMFTVSPVSAQTVEAVFGKISAEEIEMKSYEKDPDAEAVVLYDKGKSVFYDVENGYDIRFTRHKRIKIFDKSVSENAELSIPYYVDGLGKTEVVKSIDAVTYNNVDGQLIVKRLDPSNIYEERINERWYNKKFVFPDVQNGSILKVVYVIETPFHFNLPDWKFQDKIPTIYSEYEVSLIPFYEYIYFVQGISRFDYTNSVVGEKKRTWGNVTESMGQKVGNGVEFNDYISTYVLRDLPAFKDESYITSINDYIIKMDFQLAKFHSPTGGSREIISTWPELIESLLKHENFGKYISKSSRYAKKILSENLNLIGLDDNQKTIKIIEYVKNSYEWNGYYSKYASQTPKEFQDKKSGNVADINLFITSMLNEAGIEAQPLILSTRNHGKIPVDYPFDHFTNYVVVLVNTSSSFLTDGTEVQLPYNRLPTRCLNEKGLLVKKEDQITWISLESTVQSLDKKKIILELDPVSLDMNAQVFIQSTEYESFHSRKQFGDDSLKIKEYFTGKIGEVNKVKTIGYDQTTRPYSISMQSVYETEKLNKNIVLKPFLDLPMTKNGLTQKARSYPVDFIFPLNEEFESSIILPEGYTITDIPEPYHLSNDLAEINFETSTYKNELQIKGYYKLKKAVYGANEYPRIKHYIDQIVKHFNQSIVLSES